MSFKIDDNVDVPPPGRCGPKYPFADMKVGDSFFVSGRQGARIATAAYHYGKGHPPYRFITRAVDGGVRCWRIE